MTAPAPRARPAVDPRGPGVPAPPDYIDDVLARTAATRQRPGWTFPERWLPMATITSGRPPRPSAVADDRCLALLILALARPRSSRGSRTRVPSPFGPAQTASSPTPIDRRHLSRRPRQRRAAHYRRWIWERLARPSRRTAPAWRSSGRAAFGAADLVVVRPDGTDPRVITLKPLSGVRYMAWSPDSRSVAVVSGLPLLRPSMQRALRSPGSSPLT